MPTNAAKRVDGGRAPQLDFMVTEEIIATAVPKDSTHCMIADSLKAANPYARSVSADLATIRYTDARNGRRYIYLMPIVAQAALLDFDHEIIPEPFRVRGHAAQIIEPREKQSPSLSEPEANQPEIVIAAPSWMPENEGYRALSASLPETSAEPRSEEPTASNASLPEVADSSFPEVAETQAVEPDYSFPETGTADVVETEREKRQSPRRAYLMANPAGGGTVPIKVNGAAPPFGPLARGAGTGSVDPKFRTGRKRGFGLRVMGR